MKIIKSLKKENLGNSLQWTVRNWESLKIEAKSYDN